MPTINDWMQHRPWLDLDSPDIRGYVDALSERQGFDLAAVLQRWHDEGVVVFEGVVDRGLIDALLNDIDYLRRHHRDFDLLVELLAVHGDIKSLSLEELDSPGLKFNGLHTISQAAARLSLTREVVVFLTHVFQGPPCALQTLTFHRGSQQPIHVDYPYVRRQEPLTHLAASWVALEDIHPDAGPLGYYPGSHRTQVSGFFDWGGGSIVLEPDSVHAPLAFSEYLQARMQAAGIAPKVFCPRKGDVLVWHGNLSHEGMAIADPRRTRQSYVTHYTSLDAYPRVRMKPGAPATGVIHSAHGGHVMEYAWHHDLAQLPSGAALAGR